MSFLTRKPGMTLREARTIVGLHELIQFCLEHGPVPVGARRDGAADPRSIYANVMRSDSLEVESWERSFMRLKAELRDAGFRVDSEGKGPNLLADFSVDEALRREVERSIDDASKLIEARNGSPHSDAEASEEEASAQVYPVESIAQDHELGLDVRRLCRRFGIGTDRVLLILHAKGCAPREARPLRVEERRSAEVLRAALDQPKGYGFVTRVAKALGCDRKTARVLIRRLRPS